MLFTPNVQNIRDYFISELEDGNFVTDKTGCKMIELVGASFLADEETIFGEVNREYVERELRWYKSRSLNVNDIPGGPPAIWKQVADKDGFINSNYGWAIYSKENGSQYNNAVAELERNPESRRAEMIYTRPSMHVDYNKNGRSDFMCTEAVQYFVRNGQVDAVVKMRSNDVVFGYRNDFAWQHQVLVDVSCDLGIPPGDIIWQVGSLHVYERHFKLVK